MDDRAYSSSWNIEDNGLMDYFNQMISNPIEEYQQMKQYSINPSSISESGYPRNIPGKSNSFFVNFILFE